ncbi:lipopolysaccharide transport periplasmic protein LptA [Candidatus Kinetoplastibacterium desouzaii TCC079E]|uniref:Lipopolysaccharide transport periplasmic protein LptA n=1 Tax=Candidatus Kinetoplastidibacterium desouzai TCC079E TaxID=1208919 RepID=M1LSX3_9PROT|nr:LPS ABC transporter substrate-binding protein LptA [Candidatus Kinetoplastibacterium desouzaii]AGF47201.1 lipopolysaccharide transport periplasmic protein LptA [Candidatus Kinetoplastibacterium desouzaii TCC079E]
MIKKTLCRILFTVQISLICSYINLVLAINSIDINYQKNKIIIHANKASYNKRNNTYIFLENVSLSYNLTKILTNKLIVETDINNTQIYTAISETDDVRIYHTTNQNEEKLEGKCKKLEFNTHTNEIKLINNAEIKYKKPNNVNNIIKSEIITYNIGNDSYQTYNSKNEK